MKTKTDYSASELVFTTPYRPKKSSSPRWSYNEAKIYCACFAVVIGLFLALFIKPMNAVIFGSFSYPILFTIWIVKGLVSFGFSVNSNRERRKVIALRKAELKAYFAIKRRQSEKLREKQAKQFEEELASSCPDKNVRKDVDAFIESINRRKPSNGITPRAKLRNKPRPQVNKPMNAAKTKPDGFGTEEAVEKPLPSLPSGLSLAPSPKKDSPQLSIELDI